MPQPTWNTPSGSIGTFVENNPINFQFSASPGNPGNIVFFTILNGSFPETNNVNYPIKLNLSGLLTGTPTEISKDTTSSFTVRALEIHNGQIIGFRDRTFSITIVGPTVPKFTSIFGLLFTANDSTWVNYQITIESPDPEIIYNVELVSGSLPNGLEINSTGLIRGYARPPVDQFKNPIDFKVYEFTVVITSESGTSNGYYSIRIDNQSFLPGFVGRNPVILNNNPQTFDLSNDQYKAYYCTEDSINTGLIENIYSLGTVSHDNKFIFKIIGYDFEDEEINYYFEGLEAINLTYDKENGWIIGDLPFLYKELQTYTFTAYVYKKFNPSLTSTQFTFSLTVLGDINPFVKWITDSNLGFISNGEISNKAVLAEANETFVELQYSLVSGTFPLSLKLLSSGEIIGRIAFESLSYEQSKNQSTVYEFEIRAEDPNRTYFSSTKKFSLTVVQKYTDVYDNIYMKGLLSVTDRAKIDSLVKNETIIPRESLYRPDDKYYGVSKEIIYQHLIGVKSSNINDYIEAARKNHYRRTVILGPLKTAVARDQNNNIIYEVVYSEIIDNLINNQNISINKTISWPRVVNNVSRFYPASLANMRKQVTAERGIISESGLFPSWMTEQQRSGENLGFVPAFVICYTKEGWSEKIIENINSKWPHKMNEIHFVLDRFEVDKTLSNDYNLDDPSNPYWCEFPSDVITPSTLPFPTNSTATDIADFYVYFNKDILSNENDAIETMNRIQTGCTNLPAIPPIDPNGCSD